jgi:glycosyltransferase involved in cell wall biosynthesis
VLKVFFATGSVPSFSDAQERARLDAVERRRGCRLAPRRWTGVPDETFRAYNAVLCLGNAVTVATYQLGRPVYACDNFGYDGLDAGARDVAAARSHFLYFASYGQVHKGLDLLLEVFASRPDVHLHVCGAFAQERDFVRCYRRELYKTPNIHPLGWVDVHGDVFRAACRQCAYVILPSCSEGQSGAVLACMQAGLVPVLSPQAGIDTDDFGVTLPSCSLEEIAGAVETLAAWPVDRVEQSSRRASAECAARYTREAFRARVRAIIGELRQQPAAPARGTR